MLFALQFTNTELLQEIENLERLPLGKTLQLIRFKTNFVCKSNK